MKPCCRLIRCDGYTSVREPPLPLFVRVVAVVGMSLTLWAVIVAIGVAVLR